MTPPRRSAGPRRRPIAFERLHTRVWGRLALEGEVFLLGLNHIAGWCPACRAGTVEIRFIDIDPPRIRIMEPCSDGCSEDLVAQALR